MARLLFLSCCAAALGAMALPNTAPTAIAAMATAHPLQAAGKSSPLHSPFPPPSDGVQKNTKLNGLAKKTKKGGGKKSFSVSFERLLQSPILSEAFSASMFNYNAAYVPHLNLNAAGAADGSGVSFFDTVPRDCLAMRVQNYTEGGGAAGGVGGGGEASLSTRLRRKHTMLVNQQKKRQSSSNPSSVSVSSSPDGLGVGYVSPSAIAIVCEDSYLYPFSKGGKGSQPTDGGFGPWIVLDTDQALYQNLGTEDARVNYLPIPLHTEKRRALEQKFMKEKEAQRQQQESEGASAGVPPPRPLSPLAEGKEKAERRWSRRSSKQQKTAAKKASGKKQQQQQTGTLLMFYSAVNNNTVPPAGTVTAMLALAVCHLEFDPMCRDWELRGPILESVGWSKSGALLIQPGTFSSSSSSSSSSAPTTEHYLLYGDKNIDIAVTTDFLNYRPLFPSSPSDNIFMTPRDASTFFDSNLVESGPAPELLSDGESFVFLYNSARDADIPNPDPNWKLEYNLGYAIIGMNPAYSPNSTTSPLLLLDRSDEPILSPELGWETCNSASRVPGLTADVVFAEGMKRLGNPSPSSPAAMKDLFLVYYQGADARMGLGLLTVETSIAAEEIGDDEE